MRRLRSLSPPSSPLLVGLTRGAATEASTTALGVGFVEWVSVSALAGPLSFVARKEAA